jgi:hypothetical protein
MNLKLESKDDMYRRLAKLGLDSSSPDDGDALALTFAMPVAPAAAAEENPAAAKRAFRLVLKL